MYVLQREDQEKSPFCNIMKYLERPLSISCNTRAATYMYTRILLTAENEKEYYHRFSS